MKGEEEVEVGKLYDWKHSARGSIAEISLNQRRWMSRSKMQSNMGEKIIK